MANYNADISIRVVAEKAKQDLDRVSKSIANLTKSAVKISMKPLEGELNKVNNLARQVGQSLQGIGARGGIGVAAGMAANMAASMSDALGPIGQVANALAGMPDLWGQIAVAAFAFAPQLTRATQDTLKLGQASTKAIKGKLNADLKEATDRINEVNKATQNTTQVIDKLVRGASISKLNKLVSDSRAEMEGFWHNTRGAEQAAIKLVRALEAQRKEQSKIDDLVRKTQGLPSQKESQSNRIRYKAEQWRKKQRQDAIDEYFNEKQLTKEKEKQLQLEREEAKIRRIAKQERSDAARITKQRREGSARMGRLGEGLMLGAGFPMLFGGGAGAVGGGMFGALAQGAMGGKGFGAQILFSALGQAFDDFAGQTAELGQAFNALEKSAAPLVDRLGVAGTEFERQIKLLESLGEEEKAFALAREKMLMLVGDKGVDDLSQFGKETQALSNEWTQLMTQMQAGLAHLITSSGILKSLAEALNRSVLINQAYATGTEDPVIAGILKEIEDKRKDRGIYEDRRRGMSHMKKGTFETVEQFRIREAKQKTFPQLTEELITRQKILNAQEIEVQKQDLKKALAEAQLKSLQEQEIHIKNKIQFGEEEAAIQQKINEILEKNEELSREEVENAVRAIAALEDKYDEQKKIKQLYEDIETTIKNGIVDGIYEAIKGTKTLGEVASRVLDQIAKKIIESQVDKMFSSFGATGGAAAAGATQQNSNWWSKIPFLGMFGKRAAGGPVTGGSSYLVGEKGPELFVPGSSGNIVPNNAMGGMVINVDASGSSVEGDADKSRELGQMIGAAVQAEIGRQQRPGGMLY